MDDANLADLRRLDELPVAAGIEIGDFRLHDRYRWTRMKPDADAWTVQRLQP